VVRANGAVGASITTAREYLGGALEALAPFGDTPGARALGEVGDHLLASIPTVPA
jgi:hypothetical protein